MSVTGEREEDGGSACAPTATVAAVHVVVGLPVGVLALIIVGAFAGGEGLGLPGGPFGLEPMGTVVLFPSLLAVPFVGPVAICAILAVALSKRTYGVHPPCLSVGVGAMAGFVILMEAGVGSGVHDVGMAARLVVSCVSAPLAAHPAAKPWTRAVRRERRTIGAADPEHVR